MLTITQVFIWNRLNRLLLVNVGSTAKLFECCHDSSLAVRTHVVIVTVLSWWVVLTMNDMQSKRQCDSSFPCLYWTLFIWSNSVFLIVGFDQFCLQIRWCEEEDHVLCSKTNATENGWTNKNVSQKTLVGHERRIDSSAVLHIKNQSG